MVSKNEHTEKSTDPTMVARATTYSGKVARIVHVFSDEALAEYAEHWKREQKHQDKDIYLYDGKQWYDKGNKNKIQEKLFS